MSSVASSRVTTSTLRDSAHISATSETPNSSPLERMQWDDCFAELAGFKEPCGQLVSPFVLCEGRP